jgi:DNA-binding transcriptional MerR regulator
MTHDGMMPIGELARRTGVAASALCYYERTHGERRG